MKKYLLLMAVSTFVLSVNDVYAATEKKATADVTAKVIGVGEVTKDADMAFGTLVSPSTQTTVTLGTDGKISDNIVKVGDGSSAARFTIKGDSDTPYTLHVANISLNSGSNSMALGNYKIKVDDGDYLGNSSKITDGSDTILVGADLTVGAGQAPGDYEGEITLIVSY